MPGDEETIIIQREAGEATDDGVLPSESMPRWVRVGAAVIDLNSREVQRNGQRIRLTRTELQLLHALIEKRGCPVAREKLLRTIWGMGNGSLDSRAVDVNVGRLRRKLEHNPARPRLILTVSGYGYLLQDERPDA